MRIIKHFGPPGTGKTTRLMGIVKSYVERDHIPLNQITYLSFSKSAAEVIQGRMGATASDVKWFKTIHASCFANLGLSKNDVVGWLDYAAFSKLTGMQVNPDDGSEDYDVNKGVDYSPALRVYEMSLTMMKPLAEVVRMVPDHINLQPARLMAFIEAWEKWKHDNHKLTFMDMLVRYDQEGTPLPVRRGLLDEAQDLSDLQWRCAHKMLANCDEVHMAGDDDQSIYGFLGASEYGFLDHKCDEEEVLSRSYRVPEAIGRHADHVIGRVPHRKEKHVEWRDAPGKVEPVNIDPLNIPWAKWETKYHSDKADVPSIMVLARHRKGAASISRDLQLAGVSHTFAKETQNTWDETKIVYGIHQMLNGQTITAKTAIRIAEALGKPTREYRAMGARAQVGTMDGVTKHSFVWLAMNAGNKRSRDRFHATNARVKNEGWETLAVAPKIVIETMHASKGKEANLIVILPDCNNIVKKNVETATEIRLAYVALTRAKQYAHVLVPRTDTYIQHFLGA